MAKNHFQARFRPIWPKFGSQKFFLKNLASSVTRYHGQLSFCTIPEKTNDPILRKLGYGRTDKRTEGQKNESDFIGCCPTNVERLKVSEKREKQ